MGSTLGCALLVGCFDEARGSEVFFRAPGSIAVVEEAVPAATPSRCPLLAVSPDDGLVLAWTEEDAERPGHGELWYAPRVESGWGEPHRAASGGRFLVADDDAPGVVAGPEGRLYAHYRTLRNGLPLATDVRVVGSEDGGASWRPLLRLNRVLGRTGNAAATLVPAPDGWVEATWLEWPAEERDDGERQAVLRWARFHPQDGQREDGDLYEFPCPDCAPASARAPSGELLTVLRARRERRVRDVVLVRGGADDRAPPVVVAEDGWPGASCGGEGPALAVRGERVAVAWQAVGDDGRPRVRLALSLDGGRSFARPVDVAEQMPQGRVEVVFLPDDSLLVAWMEVERDTGQWRVRRVTREGQPGRALVVAECEDPGRAGRARLGVLGGDAVFAWTDPVRRRVRALLLSIAYGDPS